MHIKVERFEAVDHPDPIVGSLLAEEVNQDDWKRSDGNVLMTRGVAASLVLAVHTRSVSQPRGYLGHFTLEYVSFSRDHLTGMLNEVINAGDKGHKLSAWVSGASMYKEPPINQADAENIGLHNEGLFFGRVEVINLLGNTGIKDIHQDWLKPNEVIDELTYDTQTGHIHYKVDSVV